MMYFDRSYLASGCASALASGCASALVSGAAPVLVSPLSVCAGAGPAIIRQSVKPASRPATGYRDGQPRALGAAALIAITSRARQINAVHHDDIDPDPVTLVAFLVGDVLLVNARLSLVVIPDDAFEVSARRQVQARAFGFFSGAE